jgi:carotenoid cleavage dioxygenase-like enzyme
MVHATRIKDGVASFCNHFVDTHKLREEKRAGFPIYAKVRCSTGHRIMLLSGILVVAP